MKFNNHSSLANQHAFLSASKYHWVNYTDEKLISTYTKALAVAKGTRLHEFARECIELNQKLPRSRKSLNSYVNDAIGFRMIPEQVLYYSEHAFGTADTISFRNGLLRIHDLKTGQTKPSIMQLFIYTALFCLEYEQDPSRIEIELRIYHNSQILVHSPEPSEILTIMQKIVSFDTQIKKIEETLEDQWAF